MGSCLWDTYLDRSEIEVTRRFSSAMSSLTMLIPVYDPTLPGHTFCSTRFTRAATSPIDHNQRSISPLPSSRPTRQLPGTYLPPMQELAFVRRKDTLSKSSSHFDGRPDTILLLTYRYNFKCHSGTRKAYGIGARRLAPMYAPAGSHQEYHDLRLPNLRAE